MPAATLQWKICLKAEAHLIGPNSETANRAFILCFFWFIANWSVNASLDYTSVASSTILSSMSGQLPSYFHSATSNACRLGFFTLGIRRLFSRRHFLYDPWLLLKPSLLTVLNNVGYRVLFQS